MSKQATSPAGRYAYEHVVPFLGDISQVELARISGVHRTVISRARSIGFTAWQADQIACALDQHPAVVWPNWLDEQVAQQMYPDCGSRATAVRHRRNGEIPEGATLADVCAVCAEALAAYDRKRYRKRMAVAGAREAERRRDRVRKQLTRDAIRLAS